MQKISDNLTKVNNRIRRAAITASRNSADIQLLAVSKTRPAQEIRQAYQGGQYCFGENYLQEALEKQALLTDLPLQWHFIGPMQSNKTRAITEQFDWVHSVDRVKIAQRLSQQRPLEKDPLNICLQVNVDNEASKAGVQLEQLPEIAQAIVTLPRLTLRGLMCIPAPRNDFEQQCEVFTQLAQTLDRLNDHLTATGTQVSAHLDTLSMGMSNDLEAAIASGATIVRVGTDIFGERQK
jgi:PLP dependent protein